MKMNKPISHHLTDQDLLDYSTGKLEESFALAAAVHVSACDQCRATLDSFDAIGGTVLENSSHQEMSQGSFDKTMALISALPSTKVTRKEPSNLPDALAGYIGKSLEDIKWTPIGMGVKQKILHTGDTGTARMLYIPAGTAVPDHGHKGREWTLVLQGAFFDETGHFGPGDIEIADPTVEHTPTAAAGDACICLAVTDAPLRFSGILHRLVQPLLRI